MSEYAVTPTDFAEMLSEDKTKDYGTIVYGPNGETFIYCYTALTDVLKGDALCIYVDTGDAAGQNPRATAPATFAVLHKSGVACHAVTAAGGVWLQTGGRCTFAKVDGGTDVGINDPLKLTNAVRAYFQDHADTGTALMCAVAESTETNALAAQTPTTGTADHTVFLYDRWHAI